MRWYQRLFRRARTEKRLDAELRFHLEQQTADYIAAGMSPEEARRRARLEFGGLDQVKEDCRDVGAARFVETLMQDIRYGVRQLLRSRAFTAVAIATLAVGIGANTAIFSFVDAVSLKPLPYPHPERIVSVWEKYPGGFRNVISTLNFLDWKRQNRCFQFLSADAGLGAVTLTGSGRPQELYVQKVSASYFNVLGVDAPLGRTFAPGEDELGKDQEVVLSNAFGRAGLVATRKSSGARSPWMQKVTRSSASFQRTVNLTGQRPSCGCPWLSGRLTWRAITTGSEPLLALDLA